MYLLALLAALIFTGPAHHQHPCPPHNPHCHTVHQPAPSTNPPPVYINWGERVPAVLGR